MSAISPASPAPRLALILAALVACWVAFSFSFTPLRTSHDEWWHLKTGRYIAENGLPPNEIFTYTAESFAWHNHEWLTQLAMWGSYRLGDAAGFGGVRAVILLKTVFIILAFAGFGLLLARALRDAGHDPFWAFPAAALAAALARRTFYPRPPFVTYLLMAVLMWLFIEWRAGRLRERWLWCLPPLFALWANLHGGWMAGLLIVGAFWADAALVLAQTFVLKTDFHYALRRLGRLTLLGLACAAGTLLNPYGHHLYELAGRVFADAYLLNSIGELMPPDWRFVWVIEGILILLLFSGIRPRRPAQWLLAVALALALHLVTRAPQVLGTPHAPLIHALVAAPILLLAIARSQPPGLVAHALLCLFFAQQALFHVRHLSLWAIVLLPTLAWSLAAWISSYAPAAAETTYGTLDDLAAAAPESADSSSGGPGEPTHARQDLPAWVPGMGILFALAALWTFSSGDRLLSGYWKFEPGGGQSYLQRNIDLAGGRETSPTIVNTLGEGYPIASSLPRGVFLTEGYPVQACNFLLRARLPAPLWNGGNYAGYLIWALAPERYRLFTDNRYDIYGGLVIREEHSVLNGWTHEEIAILKQRGQKLGDYNLAWNEVLDKWKVQTIFIPAMARGNMRIAEGGWTRVYEDLSFNIWVRDTLENRAVIERAQDIPLPRPWEEVLYVW